MHFGLEDDQQNPSEAPGSFSEDEAFYQASYDALVASGYLGHHSLVILQTLILQGVYLKSSGQTATYHANLGLAIRIGNAIGLSSLDSDRSHDTSLATSSTLRPQFTQLDREMGRCIYRSLVF